MAQSERYNESESIGRRAAIETIKYALTMGSLLDTGIKMGIRRLRKNARDLIEEVQMERAAEQLIKDYSPKGAPQNSGSQTLARRELLDHSVS